MSKTAREVIADHVHDFAARVDERLGEYDADSIISELHAASFVIVPKIPDEAKQQWPLSVSAEAIKRAGELFANDPNAKRYYTFLWNGADMPGINQSRLEGFVLKAFQVMTAVMAELGEIKFDKNSPKGE